MTGNAALVTVYVELEALLDIEMAVATTLDPEAIRKWGKKWHYRPYNLEPEKQAGVTSLTKSLRVRWQISMKPFSINAFRRS